MEELNPTSLASTPLKPQGEEPWLASRSHSNVDWKSGLEGSTRVRRDGPARHRRALLTSHLVTPAVQRSATRLCPRASSDLSRYILVPEGTSRDMAGISGR